MRVGIIGPTLISKESHRHDASHVERRDDSTKQGSRAKDDATNSAGIKCRFDDLVFGIETSKRWNTDDGKITKTKSHRGNRHYFCNSSVTSHIHFIIHAMHDRTSTKEHPRFEEAMCKQVHDCKCITGRTKPSCQDHVSDLRHR